MTATKTLNSDNLRSVANKIDALLCSNQRIPAVKLVREYTGLGLYEAKCFTDDVRSEAPVGLASVRPDVILAKLRPYCADGKVLPSQQVRDVMLSVEGLLDALPEYRGDLAEAFKHLTTAWADLRVSGR